MDDSLLKRMNSTPEGYVKVNRENLPPADFMAVVYYRTADEGGRRTPVYSGYRGHVKFSFEEMQTSGMQVFIDKQECEPGEEVEAWVCLASTHFFEGKLSEGECFEVREGARVVGIGTIKQFINQKLKRPSV